MKSLRLLMILLACGATGTLQVAWTAEPAPVNTPTKPAVPAQTKPSAQPVAAESAAPKTDEDAKDEEGKEEGGAPAAAASKDKVGKDGASKADKASPQRFVPSEQVRADFDVSFPIDI